MGYAMDIKDAPETYKLVSHTVNDVTFYILEIVSWCDVGVLVMNSKEDAEKLIARNEEYTHLTEANDWICPNFVKVIIEALDNPFKNHIASRIDSREIFFNMFDKVM